LLEVNASFLVIFVLLWNEELLEHVQIHDTGNVRLHEECSVLLHYDSSKRCVCPLYKFIYSFKVVELFLKQPIYYHTQILSVYMLWMRIMDLAI
jgi:hypothetical protein